MFTRDQIEEIKKKLIMLGTKDTQFPDAHKLNGEEIIAIVQDGENKKIPLSSIINDDFINVSKDTTEILTLSTAVSKIDINNRKLGQVITFKDSANSWAIRQFTGSSLDNWNDISLWKSISGIDELKSQVETNAENISVLSDEIERHDASILNLNTDVSKLKDKDIETSSSLSELNTRVNTLKSQADTNTSNISSLNTEVSTLQSKVDENTTSISQINTELDNKNDEIAQINNTLAEHTESINAKITTDRIEDGAVTSEKISSSAFDSTLLVSGKIAPADVVGEKITELEEEILGELSASVTRYNSFQRRGEIIKHFSSGDKITLSASGTAVSNNIVVRYDDSTTNITILENNGKSSIVTLSKDTTKLIIVCNDNFISVDGTILVKAKFADSIKSIINDVKDELAEEKSRAILSEQTNAANIATLNEQINGGEVFETVEQIETVADRYLNKLNNRIGTYEGNNLSIIKYAIEKGNTYSVSIAKTCNSAGYVLAYVETLSSLDFVPVIDKIGDRGAYEGSFVSDRNGYLFLGISTDSTSNVVKKITISDSIVNDIEELKRGSVDWSDKKWFVIGDSLSTLNSTTTKRYIDYIVEKTGINVIVRAVGGSSWGQPQLTDAFFKQAFDIPTDTDIVTIFGSFNSWAKREEGVVTDGPSQGKGSVGDDGTDTYYGCVNTCFKNIYDKAPLAKVGVIFPTPWSTQNPFTYNETAETLISVIDSASKKWGIPTLDLFRRSGMRPWDLTYRQLVYSKDSGGIDGNPAGVHPNEIGHEIIATHVLEFMKTLLM